MRRVEKRKEDERTEDSCERAAGCGAEERKEKRREEDALWGDCCTPSTTRSSNKDAFCQASRPFSKQSQCSGNLLQWRLGKMASMFREHFTVEEIRKEGLNVQGTFYSGGD